MTVKRQITTAWWNSFYIWCQYLITGLAFSNLGLERLDLLLGLLQLTHTLTRCALILRQLTLLLLNQPLRHRQITQTNTLKCLLWNILKFDATLLFWLLNEHICLKKKPVYWCEWEDTRSAEQTVTTIASLYNFLRKSYFSMAACRSFPCFSFSLSIISFSIYWLSYYLVIKKY